METLPQQHLGADAKTASGNTKSTWLCTSDVDGTLVTAVGAIMPKRNKTAIARFRSLGGQFTIASGRSAPSVAKLMDRLRLTDIPAIVLNGAGVFDSASGKMLRYHPIPKEGTALAFALCRKFPRVQFHVHRQHSTHFWNLHTTSFFASSIDRQPRHFHRSLADFPQDGWGKGIFYGSARSIIELRDYCRSLTNVPLSFMETSSISFEVLAPGVHKGSALLELAELLGIDAEHTAAIGNYDNDAGLLACAAVTAAPSNSPESFKALAQHIVSTDAKGAVADFLAILEDKLVQK
ncbi:MAG: HAD family hydrolase [Oscillospiraceae bacterium]|jgi:Cof subfamily protein (haloacid dehalogenase superfamily)|nr:HAD family hydrolase [Oscillospiraceae bacterium]